MGSWSGIFNGKDQKRRCVKPFSFLAMFLTLSAAMSYLFNYMGVIQIHSQIISLTEPTPHTVETVKMDRTKIKFRPPHQHVYYLKTHKTGSTSMYAIFAEYSRSHELVSLLPSGQHINQGGRVLKKQLMTLDNVKAYDMVFSHHVYSPSIWKYLHNDSFKITSLREPFDNFVSAFLYYRNKWHNPYLVKVPTNDPLTEFLRHPDKYETNGYYSWTNNRQSMDLGYDLSKGFKNMEYVKQFIQASDRRFDLVLIMEYFDEGLVMMKRALRWNTKDIIYLSKNTGNFYSKDAKRQRTSLETQRRKLHANFSQPDIMLYDHFLNRFKEKMAKEVGLKSEVAEFRDILVKFRNYCDSIGNDEALSGNLVFPTGKWNEGFVVTPLKCRILSFDFFKITSYLKERQLALFLE